MRLKGKQGCSACDVEKRQRQMEAPREMPRAAESDENRRSCCEEKVCKFIVTEGCEGRSDVGAYKAS